MGKQLFRVNLNYYYIIANLYNNKVMIEYKY